MRTLIRHDTGGLFALFKLVPCVEGNEIIQLLGEWLANTSILDGMSTLARAISLADSETAAVSISFIGMKCLPATFTRYFVANAKCKWGVSLDSKGRISRVDAGHLFAREGVQVGWTLLAVNGSAEFSTNKRVINNVFQKGDACTITFKTEETPSPLSILQMAKPIVFKTGVRSLIELVPQLEEQAAETAHAILNIIKIGILGHRELYELGGLLEADVVFASIEVLELLASRRDTDAKMALIDAIDERRLSWDYSMHPEFAESVGVAAVKALVPLALEGDTYVRSALLRASLSRGLRIGLAAIRALELSAQGGDAGAKTALLEVLQFSNINGRRFSAAVVKALVLLAGDEKIEKILLEAFVNEHIVTAFEDLAMKGEAGVKRFLVEIALKSRGSSRWRTVVKVLETLAKGGDKDAKRVLKQFEKEEVTFSRTCGQQSAGTV